MRIIISKAKVFALLAFLVAGFIACGVGGDTGRLSLSLTDKPADEAYQAVYVSIKEIAVHAADDPEDAWTTILNVEQTINLKDLTNGVRKQLGMVDLAPGRYTQMRIMISEFSYAGTNAIGEPHPVYGNYVIDDAPKPPDPTELYHELKIPSGLQTGVKLVHEFEINAKSTTELTLDFEASRSVVVAGNSGKYILKPTIQVMDDETRTIIKGRVTTKVGETTVGVPGALVSLQHYVDKPDPQIDEVNVKWTTYTDDETGDKGAYMFFFLDVPEPIKLNIVATHKDYAPDWDFLPEVKNGDMIIVDDLLLSAPAEVGTVDITISGAATDETPVILSVRQAVIAPDSTTVMIEVMSLEYANGTYHPVLPVGDYKVVASTTGKSSLELPLKVTKTPNAILSVSFPAS